MKVGYCTEPVLRIYSSENGDDTGRDCFEGDCGSEARVRNCERQQHSERERSDRWKETQEPTVAPRSLVRSLSVEDIHCRLMDVCTSSGRPSGSTAAPPMPPAGVGPGRPVADGVKGLSQARHALACEGQGRGVTYANMT